MSVASWASALTGNWVPGLPPFEVFPAFNFAVEIDGLLAGGFTEVRGLDSRLDTEEFREGGVNGPAHTLVNSASSSTLTLRHGLTASSALWDWHADAVRGRIKRRNGTIMLLDRSHVPVMWWDFRNGLPVAWTGPEFDSSADQVGFESIEIAHEGLTQPELAQMVAKAHTAAQFAADTVRYVR